MSIKMFFVVVIIGMILFGLYQQFSAPPPLKNIPPSGTNIICLGDSLTSGEGASAGMDYPSQLARMIGRPVINAGLGGDTTALALKRLQRDVLTQSPRIVIVVLGGNDLLHKVPRLEAFQNMRRIINAIQERGALVVVGGIDVPLWGRSFGSEYKKLARETGSLLVPNIFDGMFGNSQFMSDHIHCNDNGYRLMAERFYEVIEKHL